VVRRLAKRLDSLLRAEHGGDVAGRFIALEQLWLHDEVMRPVAFSPRLAGPAAELLGEPAIRIELRHCTSSQAYADVDPHRITQILANLLRNALAATPPGGAVTVTTSHAGHTATVEVSDTGRGIAPADLERIFERFERVPSGDERRNPDRAGSGIGLTIARSLARAHGGELTATSGGVGRGTTRPSPSPPSPTPCPPAPPRFGFRVPARWERGRRDEPLVVGEHLGPGHRVRRPCRPGPACPREATPARPPASQAYRHRRTDRSLTRSSAAITADGARCSNLFTASSRTCSQRLRPSAVSPPPCAYRMYPAYRYKQHTSPQRTSPIKGLYFRRTWFLLPL
jgi:anti-sigma regulatory factor (Ser/Thr protein kinase)